MVQGPQDYRDGQDSFFKAMCFEEYRGFFHIGMVERNEHDAIIQHGTMTIVRRDALEEVGRWSTWCITEDTELGLKLFEAGYSAAYIPESMGRGLTPDTLARLRHAALSLGLWRDADRQAARRRVLPRPHQAHLVAALSVPERLAALDFRRPRPDRHVLCARLDAS